MAVAVREALRVCPSCGDEFVDRRVSGAPRTYCETCSPIRSKRRASAPLTADAEDSVAGDPFTLDHFRGWASHLVLDTGDPWILEPYQEAFVEDLFSGTPEVWLIVPEGNGKTTTFAGLALYHCEFMPTGTVLVAASSRDQAQIMYLQADGLVRRSGLEYKFRLQEGTRRIRCDDMGSRIQVLASDDRTGDGVIPTLCLVDELHRHRDMKLYRTWAGKLLKRHGQMAVISTAGEPGTEFEEARERIRQTSESVERVDCFVRAASETLILHEYAVSEDGDVDDMAVVKRANPFSGITVEQLQSKHDSPTMTPAHWRRFVCNLPTRGEAAAVQEAEWFAASTGDDIPLGESVWLGLDLGWKWDTTAMAPLWWEDSESRLLGNATILTPPRDGSSLDPNEVESALLAIHRRNPIHTVVMDTNHGEQLAEWISSELGCLVVDRAQTNTEAELDFARFMEALRSGWLKHSGDRELTRHVLNAITRLLPNGGARFDRPAQSRRSAEQDRRVIDGLTAASMVHSYAVHTHLKHVAPMVMFG